MKGRYQQAFCCGVLTLFWSLRVTLADTMYISQGGAHYDILKYDLNGQSSIFANPGTALPENLGRDPSGNVYAGLWQGLGYGWSYVDRYDSAGRGTTIITNLFEPRSVVGDNAGNLYVGAEAHGDGPPGEIWKVAANGQASLFAAGLPASPDAMAVDAQNNLYVAQSGVNQLVKLTPNGQQSVVRTGIYPEGLAFDSQGNLFISNWLLTGTITGQILELRTDGQLSTFASDISPPSSLAFDSSGSLYALMIDLGAVEKFDSFGNASVFAANLRDPSSMVIVPEPGSLGLLSAGAVLAIAMRGNFRRRFVEQGKR